MLMKFVGVVARKTLLMQLVAALLGVDGRAQTTTCFVDPFNPSGTGGHNYGSGQITNVWGNWFGGAFQSLAWDPASDAGNDSSSGSMKITANFTGNNGNSQFAVYDFNGIYPPVNGRQYTNFQCDVRFAPGSATTTNGNVALFGHLMFGVTDGFSQDYFGGVDIPAGSTNWVHVNLPINATDDPNLSCIYNVLVHVYGPYYSPGLNGASTLWVDNIKFSGEPPMPTNCIVDWNDVHQRIDGFGASSGFDSTWTTNQADMFFSTNAGIGLSLLKTVIAAGGTTVETNIMQMAQARGARIWSTPYSPQASFKDNHNVNGGNFLSASNQAYASQLAGYVVNLKQNFGVSLYAISVQNEPDVAASYPSCLWTPQQIHDFVPYLYNALVASNVASTKILLAEDEHWQTNYYTAAMSDPAVAVNVGIIACHNYDGTPPSGIPGVLPKFANAGAAIWETEVSTFDPFDGSITNAMYWAGRIHLFLTVAQANAFNYWWLVCLKSDNEGLTDQSGNPAKRMYVLGNYSRFVRPGYCRIGVSNNAFTAISAFKDTSSDSFAIVAINSSATAVTQIFNLSNFTAGSVTPWITSDALSLSNQPTVGVTNATFTYTLPALSVVTFVGQAGVAATSIVIAHAAFNGNAFVIGWNSTAGATYSVLRTNVLSGLATNWPAIVTGYPAGGAAGGFLSATDTTAGATLNFYRVRSP
jgi:glucuronoarabinoxylan endo-1,4-beta-xylanase